MILELLIMACNTLLPRRC